MANTAIVLSIAGSDSGGGAGIQADIKAISATGGYACTAITALTAQNTLGVTGIHGVPPAFIRDQLDSVFSDLDIKAVKIGMLGDADTIECIALALKAYQPKNVVLDPVMVATSGDLLLQESAVQSLRETLIPLADVITPNLYEALVLLGKDHQQLPETAAEFEEIAIGLQAMGSSVLLKGGHHNGTESIDVLLTDNGRTELSSPRFDTNNTHGTGCTLSSALASYLAQGYELATAAQLAKSYIAKAIETADQLQIGKGHGPVNHFHVL